MMETYINYNGDLSCVKCWRIVYEKCQRCLKKEDIIIQSDAQSNYSTDTEEIEKHNQPNWADYIDKVENNENN